jgi:hypothetical protein
MNLKTLQSGYRRPPVPQLVDQAVGRDDLVAVQQQQRQQRSSPTTADNHPWAAVHHLKRP